MLGGAKSSKLIRRLRIFCRIALCSADGPAVKQEQNESQDLLWINIKSKIQRIKNYMKPKYN